MSLLADNKEFEQQMQSTLTDTPQLATGFAENFREISERGETTPPGVLETVQEILMHEGDILQREFLNIALQRVEQRRTIIRKVFVNRGRNSQQMIDATGCAQNTCKSVVDAIPHDGIDNEEVVFEFFRLSRYSRDATVEQERIKRGLTRDIQAQLAVIKADTSFVDKHSNSVSWQDTDGIWCSVAFSRNNNRRDVYVSHDSDGWGSYWWYGGVRK